tara:strand:- start:890 stop:1108 length:219 start_codon:yes stop_codon:yes gene_type:complete
MEKDELVLKISDALNQSRFWMKLEEKIPQISDEFIEELAYDLEEYVADKIQENMSIVELCERDLEDFGIETD